jgi:hypothetical protein
MHERSGGRTGQKKTYALEEPLSRVAPRMVQWGTQQESGVQHEEPSRSSGAANQGLLKANGLIKKVRHIFSSWTLPDVLTVAADDHRNNRWLRPPSHLILYSGRYSVSTFDQDIQPAGHLDFGTTATNVPLCEFPQSSQSRHRQRWCSNHCVRYLPLPYLL